MDDKLFQLEKELEDEHMREIAAIKEQHQEEMQNLSHQLSMQNQSGTVAAEIQKENAELKR